MTPAEPTVYVIDDDESIRELLVWLMRRNQIRAEAFPNARSFLKAYRPEVPGCLILDLYMPGMSGLELQVYLREAGIDMPVIFLSGRADVPKAVHAVKSGAIDFIEKPFDYKRIVELVGECLRRDAASRGPHAFGILQTWCNSHAPARRSQSGRYPRACRWWHGRKPPIRSAGSSTWAAASLPPATSASAAVSWSICSIDASAFSPSNSFFSFSSVLSIEVEAARRLLANARAAGSSS